MSHQFDLTPPAYRAARRRRRHLLHWLVAIGLLLAVTASSGMPVRLKAAALARGNAELAAVIAANQRTHEEVAGAQRELAAQWQAWQLGAAQRLEPAWPAILGGLATAAAEEIHLRRLEIRMRGAATGEAGREITLEGLAPGSPEAIGFLRRLAALPALERTELTETTRKEFPGRAMVRFAMRSLLP